MTLADGGGSDDKRAVLDGIGERLEFLGTRKQQRGANGRTCLAKSQFIGVHNTEMEKAEVAHGASSGADVERVARCDKNDSKSVEFGVGRQWRRVYSRGEVMK